MKIYGRETIIKQTHLIVVSEITLLSCINYRGCEAATDEGTG
jgi:hypothetical protein